MVKNIIFDLGDVFINLDHHRSEEEMEKLGLEGFSDEMIGINMQYEKGLISTPDFISFYNSVLSVNTDQELIDSWNSVLSDFPLYRLSFLEQISKTYRLFLLSNTNELHIGHFKSRVGDEFYNKFFQCFEGVYYSNEINSRKPERDAFEIIINNNDLNVMETLFVDDTFVNIEAANKLGLNTWHIKPNSEDVIELFNVKGALFNQKEFLDPLGRGSDEMSSPKRGSK